MIVQFDMNTLYQNRLCTSDVAGPHKIRAVKKIVQFQFVCQFSYWLILEIYLFVGVPRLFRKWMVNVDGDPLHGRATPRCAIYYNVP